MFTPDNDDGLTYEGLLPLDNPGDQHGWRTDYYCGLSGLTFTTTQTSLLRLIISGPVYTPSCRLYLGLRQQTRHLARLYNHKPTGNGIFLDGDNLFYKMLKKNFRFF